LVRVSGAGGWRGEAGLGNSSHTRDPRSSRSRHAVSSHARPAMLTASSTLSRPTGRPAVPRTAVNPSRGAAAVARASSNEANSAGASAASFAAAAVLSLLAAAGPASADLNRLEAAAGGGEEGREKKEGLGPARFPSLVLSTHVRAFCFYSFHPLSPSSRVQRRHRPPVRGGHH